MKSIKSFEKRLDNLAVGLKEPINDKYRAFRAKFTREEFAKVGDLLVTHRTRGLTQAESETLAEILERVESRSPVSLPPINPTSLAAIAVGNSLHTSETASCRYAMNVSKQ